MPRKSSSNLIDDLLEIATTVPWWVGLALAAVSYAILSTLASSAVPAATTVQDLSSSVVRSALRAVAAILQFAIPIVFLLGSVLSIRRARQRAKLISSVTGKDAAETINCMPWESFERLISEAFRLDGFHVLEKGGAHADGGVDLVLRREGETYLVQCKHWRATKVGVEIVRELFGAMAAQGATGGFVVTSGVFTTPAAEFAAGRNIVLLDGPVVLNMIVRAERVAMSNPLQPTIDSASPNCPRCGKAMVKRVARQGAKSGSAFWGCSGYPGCRGTREVGAG